MKCDGCGEPIAENENGTTWIEDAETREERVYHERCAPRDDAPCMNCAEQALDGEGERDG